MMHYKRGFTLAELVVSMAIISIIVTVLLGNRDQYSERLILKNQTYNVALFIRQAQVYSLGVKAGGNPTSFDTSYGVSFTSTPQDSFKFFTDQNKDGRWQLGEVNQDIAISNGVTIQDVCVYNPVAHCFSEGWVGEVILTFKRPDSAAVLKVFDGLGGYLDFASLASPVTIKLVSKTGLTSSIQVEATGGISIEGI